jgi:hypothetical protein
MISLLSAFTVLATADNKKQVIFQGNKTVKFEIGIFLQPDEAVEKYLYAFLTGKNRLPTCNRQGVEVRIGFVQDLQAVTSHSFVECG